MSVRWILPALLMAVLPGAVLALPGDADQEIRIQADSWDADRRSGRAVYRGNVVVTSGGLELRGDELILRFDDGALVGATITGGPATLVQQHEGDRAATSAQAGILDYDALAAVIRLRGTARVLQGGDEFASEEIRYDVRQERVVAGGDPGSRIEVIIQPRRPQAESER